MLNNKALLNKVLLATGTTSPAFTPFDTTSIGPACPPSAGSTLPTISSHLIKENISDPSAILSAVVFWTQLHTLPIAMDTSTFDKVKETALALMQAATGRSLQHFVHPELVHHQLLLGLHSLQLNSMLTAPSSYKKSVAFQEWSHNLILLLLANQCGFLQVQYHLQSAIYVICAPLLTHVPDQSQADKVGQTAWQESIQTSHTSQGAGLDNLIQQLSRFQAI
ncbi:hypothetical protein DSO57_1030715 [Entomophthora muscae]|uniref:Uncharacterized protein n=1 Tax=Entomophthora muscae TaxID=34485 RepID=A0ACC2SPX1_9FUNG|nr:hypothetical protein DSO57_1030715 [Entomophthora muscae]